jgi:replicative DNA helicase
MTVEQIVLGTAIHDPTTIEEISHLRVSDFTHLNADLFDIIMALYNEDSLSYAALVETLKKESLLDIIGDNRTKGEAYLRSLLDMADSRGIKSHVRMIEDRAVRKNLREVAALIAANANNEGKDIQEVMDDAEKRIFNLRRRAGGDEGVEFADLIRTYLPFIDGMRSGEITPAWEPPLKALRDLVQYVDRTEFVIIAGRPGEGKSSLLRYLALRTTMERSNADPQKVITFNLENDPWEYVKFAISTITGINSGKLKKPKLLNEDDYKRFRAGAETLVRVPWTIITLSRPKVMEIDRIARKKVSEGAELVLVDYVQLISNSMRNRVEDLAETTGTLRGVALKTSVPVIAACQLSRAIEHRGENAEPQLSDLRESGSIEQDATQVWFIRSEWNKIPTPEQVTNPQYYFPENFDSMGRVREPIRAVPVRIWVKKNRNGPIGHTTPIKWNKSTGEFSSFTTRRHE